MSSVVAYITIIHTQHARVVSTLFDVRSVVTFVAACTTASSESFCVVVPVLSLASPSCIPLARLCLHGSRYAVLSCDVQSGSALLRV
jgi:hypothetical protein